MHQLRLQIDAQHCEQVEELMFACGAVSVSLEDAADEAILEPAIGEHPLWSTLFMQAHFADEQTFLLAEKALQNDSSVHQQISLSYIEDQDWQAKFQQQFTAMQFGSLWIYPSWEENPDTDGISLQLDPGLAFGTGQHATTHLCLNYLAHTSLQDLDVIDFGCGSGILALAACKLGARHIYAVDIDPQAVMATHDNIARNRLAADQFTVGDIRCIEHIKSDLIVANILAAPLIELRDTFFQHLKPGGRLIISGILGSQIMSIRQHYDAGFEHLDSFQQDDWACIAFSRHAL